MRELVLIAAVALLPSVAFAGMHGGHFGHEREFDHRGAGERYEHGHGFGEYGHGFYGHREGRFWHGRYWNYGIGRCWEALPDGAFVWVCGD